MAAILHDTTNAHSPRRRLLRLAAALAAALLLWGILPIQAAASDSLRVGFFSFDGYHMIDAYGRRSGYGYDYLQNLAQYADFTYQYVGYEKSWQEMQEMLEQGEIDLLTSAQKTPSRMARFDFSEQPIGSSSTILTVKAGDVRYIDDDYTKLDGIRVGMLEGNSRNENFRSFAADWGFSYQPVYFTSVSDMTAALQQGGGIDGIVTSSLRRPENEWIVAAFDPSPFYIIVRKGDQALLDRVNQAIEQLTLYAPNLQSDLYNRYYSASTGDDVAYTAAERAYIQSRRDSGAPVRLLLNPDRMPLSYFEDGQAQGILTTILRQIMDRTGLPYEIVPLASREDYETALRQGDAQACFDSRYEFNKAEQEGYKLTSPYLTATVSCVTRKDSTQEPARVAAVRQADITEAFLVKNYAEGQIFYYPSVDDCVNAVLAGEADAVYLYTYTAQQYLYRDERNQLQETLIPDFSVSFSVAVGQREDPLLFSILNKAVLSLRDEDITGTVRELTAYPVKAFTFRGYLHSHPAALAVMVLFCMLLIAGVVSGMFQQKTAGWSGSGTGNSNASSPTSVRQTTRF